MPSIPPGEFPLLVHMDELVENLRTHVPKALKQWDAEAIHQARVATRRLKAALDLLKPVLSKSGRRAFGRELRRLRRRLGPLRDIDVMIAHLEELGQDRRLAPAPAWASAALCRDREAARQESSAQASPAKVLSRLGQWWGLRDEVAEAREAVNTLLCESLHLQIDAFAEQAEALLAHRQTAGVTSEAAQPAQHPVDPHQLRIAGKALRYTLEMGVKEGHPLPKDVAKTFKQMQECLGLWHDFVVLSDRVLLAAVAQQLGHHDTPTQEKVLELSKTTLRKSARQIDRFCKLWAQRGDELARTIRQTFPLTRPPEAASPDTAPPAAAAACADAPQPPTQSETDPGPSGSAQSSAPAPSPPASASVA